MKLKETPGGLVIEVRVRPNSGAFRLHEDGTLEVRSPPSGGKANMEIIRELRKRFRTGVRILRGRSGRRKTILLKNISKQELKD